MYNIVRNTYIQEICVYAHGWAGKFSNLFIFQSYELLEFGILLKPILQTCKCISIVGYYICPVYTCMHEHTYIHILACTHACTHAHPHAPAPAPAHAHTHTHTHTHTNTHTHTHTHTSTPTHTHPHPLALALAHSLTLTLTHTHTHTHTHYSFAYTYVHAISYCKLTSIMYKILWSLACINKML